MAGLLDIASSGIQAYRKALSVTGQNISNIDTEGYRRREINLGEITASQTDITTISEQTGLGVQVKDIARAFDSFLSERARNASSDYNQADAKMLSMTALEKEILPSEYDISYFLSDFFDGLNSISQAPADTSGRMVALAQGQALAGSFSQTAAGLEALKSEIMAQAQLVADDANSILASFQNTQRQVIASANSQAGANAILDARDKTLADLSKLVGTTVVLASNGSARVTLGASGNGPILSTATEKGTLAIEENDGRLIVLTGKEGGLNETQELSSGQLAGLISAYESVDGTIKQLDALAARLVREFNAIHSQGLTLDKTSGGLMFTADNWSIQRANSNLGDFSTTISAAETIPDGAETIEFIYQKSTNEWIGTFSDGTASQHPGDKLTLDGVQVSITGQPADGDSFVLGPSVGKAANMRFLLSRPEEFAAASLIMANADAANVGSGTIELLGEAQSESPNIPILTDILTGDYSNLAAQRLLENGPVGFIPANAGAVDIASLTRQNQITFSLTDTEIATAAELTLTIDGSTHVFAWPDSTPLAQDADNLSRVTLALNSGAIQDANSKNISDFGLYAAAVDGNLTIASNGSDITSGTFGSSTGDITPKISSASQIQIFTREGRQLAGVPLSQTEVLRYMTTVNGFSSDAEYRADYLNQTYRGIDITRESAKGAETLTLSGNGFLPYQSAGTELPMRSSEGGEFDLRWQTGDPANSIEERATVTIPQGVMAGYIADLVNAQTADSGLHAKAVTRAVISDVKDGAIAFDINGTNEVPLTIRANISDGSLDELAIALNARSGETGFSAALSSDGSNLFLINEAGDDLAIDNIVSTGGTFKIGAADDSGHLRDATLTVGDSSTTALRIGGEIKLTAPLGFSATYNQTTQQSTADAFVDGLMSRTIDAGGSWQEVNFSLDEAFDSNAAGVNGLSASVADTELTLKVENASATIKTGSLPNLETITVAKAMANELRAQGTVPSLTGESLSTLPDDGSAIQIFLGTEIYSLKMVDGEISVSGPESERISAYFDAANKLQISAQDGTLSGQALSISPDTSSDEASLFGLTTNSKRIITGRSFALPTTGTTQTFQISVDNTISSISVSYDATNGFQSSGLPSNVELSFTTDSETSLAYAQLSISGTYTSDVRVLDKGDEGELGLYSANTQVTISDTGLRVKSVDGSAISLSGASSSSVGDRLHLSGTPPEDLIVLVTGSGARRLTADVVAQSPAEPALPDLEVRVMDATSGRIELFERSSGQSLATRYVDQYSIFNAAGYGVRLNGALQDGDLFTIAANLDGTGNAANMHKLIELQDKNQETNTGGFANEFGGIVTSVGAKARAANVTFSETLARKDAAIEQEAEYSGVNLDTEAARLLEQQQAYQALARVLQTSTQLMDTLLNAIA